MASSSIPYVEAGACISEGVVKKCALEKTACAPGDLFLSSRALHASGGKTGYSCLYKAKTEAVSIGRCTGDSDFDICTGTASSCTVEDRFAPEADACSIARDDQPFDPSKIFAYYGSCKPSSSSNEFDCYWDSSECPRAQSQSFWTAASQTTKCTCDYVKTGACTFPGDDIYYCAVSSNGCDIAGGETYISATALREISGAPDCRLCRHLEGHEQPPIIKKDYVEAGACEGANESSSIKCVLDKTQCLDGTFRSPVSLLEAGYAARGEHCSSRGETEQIKTGRCTSGVDLNTCTGLSNSTCQVPGAFEPMSEDCNMLEDIATSVHSLYGICTHTEATNHVTQGQCFADARECPTAPPNSNVTEFDYHWYIGAVASDCSCDNTFTGACKKDRFYACSISPEACDTSNGEVWIPAARTIDVLGVECYLCREQPVPSPSPTLRPTAQPTTVVIPSGLQEKEQRYGVMIGAVIGTCVALVLIFVLSYRLQTKSSNHDPNYKPGGSLESRHPETEFS
mmetsp:Transcript_12425/g.18885  ORF Transcript_12425/g.18885 Transcript_12425/m.18885 type:complete len:512 (-) Transcript_12425:133-1668(-)|eukprot:CAMPEP_0118696748 /NCGR_PEP_ID=MMETSP0800-20121206/14045_1 /TAXON_ID=210618 ORGANISM="Striatella unipunctata, Strain CCMP2910" /NCGR_SAMPLE_ID=MMETSP0800 /ASSEMBLY_ACC=CAM_ASM_000638 /LENGTH=511 /DNA_ID=CAMNT_0006595947 /DNA_START=816 /DNA_END=2351 /DNA_ORIENTATION=-